MWGSKCLRDDNNESSPPQVPPTNTLISPIRMSPVEKQSADGIGVSVCRCKVGWGRAGRTDDGSGGVAVSVRGATGEFVQLSGNPSGALYRIALVRSER